MVAGMNRDLHQSQAGIAIAVALGLFALRGGFRFHEFRTPKGLS